MLFSQDKAACSAFEWPVWTLGTQRETKESSELLKTKCPLIFKAFSADHKLLIGNGHRHTEE